MKRLICGLVAENDPPINLEDCPVREEDIRWEEGTAAMLLPNGMPYVYVYYQGGDYAVMDPGEPWRQVLPEDIEHRFPEMKRANPRTGWRLDWDTPAFFHQFPEQIFEPLYDLLWKQGVMASSGAFGAPRDRERTLNRAAEPLAAQSRVYFSYASVRARQSAYPCIHIDYRLFLAPTGPESWREFWVTDETWQDLRLKGLDATSRRLYGQRFPEASAESLAAYLSAIDEVVPGALVTK